MAPSARNAITVSPLPIVLATVSPAVNTTPRTQDLLIHFHIIIAAPIFPLFILLATAGSKTTHLEPLSSIDRNSSFIVDTSHQCFSPAHPSEARLGLLASGAT